MVSFQATFTSMKLNFYKVIGLMSGTSLDGLDLAYCHFYHNEGDWKFELIESTSISYSKSWEQKLQSSIDISSEELLALDIAYGKLLGKLTNDFIETNKLDVDFIASHGHTVFHQPGKGFTLQIGSGQEVSKATGKKVISNFRSKDVAFGGQGAPLVPIGDQLLFGEYTACLNLGGIANASFNVDNERVAFDIGMANMLLNHLANKKGLSYDKSGEIAASGSVDNELLSKLNALSYFNLPYPKSLGVEWFLSDVLPLIESSSSPIEDLMATAVEHEANQIGKVLKEHVPSKGNVLITGGGAFNTHLINRIKSNSENLNIVIPDAKTIDFKEAIIFAFMGVLKEREEPNCLKSVTGASIDVSGGEVFLPY